MHIYLKQGLNNAQKFYIINTKIGTPSVHVGSLSKVSQDTCTSVSIVIKLD